MGIDHDLRCCGIQGGFTGEGAKTIIPAFATAKISSRLVPDQEPEEIQMKVAEYLNKVAEMDEIDTVIKAYQLYQEQTQAQGLEALLSVTRAWRLVKFVDNGMLTMTKCSKCGGHFVTHPHEIARHYVCGLCNPPARAGKGKAAGGIQMH